MTRQPTTGPLCVYCWHYIYRHRDGSWYHFHNGSRFCRPGIHASQKATP